MASFILSAPPSFTSPSFQPQTTRRTITSTIAHPHRHPPHRPLSSSISTLYRPPNPDRPALQTSRDSNHPPPSDDFSFRRDDDGDHFSSDPNLLAALARLFREYNYLLQTAPLATKAISAGVLALISDIVAQALNSAPTDFMSLARFALYGLLMAGPQGHFWFQTLENLVRVQGFGGIAMKLFMDQLFFLPVSTAAFFLVMKIGEGMSVEGATDFMRGNLKNTLFSAWKVWPFVNFVNFAFVPAQMRVVFVSTVSIFWVAYLSVVSSQGPQREEKFARRMT